MKDFKLILVVILQLLTIKVWSQITVESSVEPTQIFIGQQAKVCVKVSAPKSSIVEFPHYDSLQSIIPGVEVLNVSPADTDFINNGQHMVIQHEYIVTSFDSALYYIPPFQVKVQGKDYAAEKNLALKVVSIPIDTTDVEQIFPNKDVMQPPFDWHDWKTPFILSFILAILTLTLLYILVRIKDNKPIIKHIRIKQRIAPHKVAMGKIEQIKVEKKWQLEDSKEYYTQLTDILRQYINERYGFNATEMTSDEIINHLHEFNEPDALAELQELFQTADLVKFAKYNTQINENDRNLVCAIDYINTTKIEELTTPQQPEEITIEEQRSSTTRYLMYGTVAFLSISIIILLGFMVYSMWQIYI